MFGKPKKLRVLFLREVISDGVLYEVGEVEELPSASAKKLIADGDAEATTQPVNRFDRRHEGGDWRRNEARDWGERHAAMQQPQ